MLCGCMGRAPRGDTAATWLLVVCPVLTLFLVTSPLFLCATGILPAAAPVVNPGVGAFGYGLKLCWPFKQQKPGSFFCLPNSCWFLQPEVTGIYLHGDGTLGSVVWLGLGSFSPKVSLPSILRPAAAFPHHAASLPISATLRLLPVWMNVSSLNPWLSDFHAALFSDISRYY